MLRSVRKIRMKLFVAIIIAIPLVLYCSNKVSAAGLNLIRNGDFEFNPEYVDDTWEGYSTSDDNNFVWDSTTYHGAIGRSMKIQGNNVTAFISNTVDVQPNQVYNFSAWKKANNVLAGNDKLGTTIQIVQLNSNGDIIDGANESFDEDGTFDWKQVNCNFVTNSDAASVFLVLALDGSGSVWFDDVSLIDTNESIPTATPSFECNPGGNRSTFVGINVNLDGSKSIGQSLNYQWRLISKPDGSQSELINSDLVNPSFTPDVLGDYTIGLTVSDGERTSQEEVITVRAKAFNDTSDDMCYSQFSRPTCISGYMVGNLVPLADGWVILSDINKNKIVIINGITGEVAKEYQLDASPTNIVFDFDKNFIIATQKNQNKIAKINIINDEISYITTTDDAKLLTIGEGDFVFAYTEKLNADINYIERKSIGIIDLVNNVELKVVPITPNFIGFMKYDKINHNLFLGASDVSPSALYRYSYDIQNQSFTYAEYNWNPGPFANDLAVSSDGKHLAFVCPGGNGTFDIFDYDSTNILNHNGAWFTDASPYSADFSSDNQYLVATNRSKTMLFDVNSHEFIRDLCSYHSAFDFTNRVRFSRGNSIVFNCVKNNINDNYNSVGSKIYLERTGVNSSVDPVTIENVDVDHVGLITTNDEVNVLVDASGGVKKQYGFLVYNGDSWSTLQTYSDNSSITWKPTEPGEYAIAVEVKDKYSSNGYDDLYIMNYEVTVPKSAKPIANPSSGMVTYGSDITLTTSTSGATIYYTTDGSTPSSRSNKYTDPITVTNAVTIKAIAIKEGLADSSVMSESYTIKVNEPTGGGGSTGGGTSPGGGAIFGGGGPIGPVKEDQKPLVITGIPENITYGDPSFELSTSGGSGKGTVSYKVISGSFVIDLSGNTVTILKAGKATIKVTKEGDSTYNSISTTIDIIVQKAEVKINSLPTVTGTIDYGTPLSEIKLSGGEASVPGVFVWISPEIIVDQTGYYEVKFVPTDSENYSNATTFNNTSVKVKLTASKKPMTLTFATKSKTIALDQSFKMKAFVDDESDGAFVTYSSSNESVATVSSDGKVTPKKVGSTIITAKTANGLAATYKLVVKKAPLTINIDYNSYTLSVGKSISLKPSVEEGACTTFTYSSSNKNVVTVSKNGKITAKKKGTAIITIKTHNGLIITCKIKVK